MSSPVVLSPTRCLVCNSPNILPIIEVPPVPVDTNRIWSRRADAVAATRAAINLVSCVSCGHTFNRIYNDELVDYEVNYENSQMFSPRFRQYCEELSDNLIGTHGLHHKSILEIGGGKGDFLRVICDRGDNRGVSFDPSYRPKLGEDIPPNVRFVPDFYTAKYADEPADIIICRHVLEHIWSPRDLIDTVREAVGDRPEIVMYFEMPNGDFILKEQAIWELHYQHCSYFTKTSLVELFNRCGLGIRDIRESFGRQFLAITTNVPKSARISNLETADKPEIELYEGFGAAFRERVSHWQNQLDHFRADGKRVVAWGAGAKAVTFLNIVRPASDVISHVIDINPRKAETFIPGAGQEVVAANVLQELHPEVILLMNGIYQSEIISMVHELGLDPVILVV